MHRMNSNKNTPGLSQQHEDFKLFVCMLASGSKGNAIYVSDGSTSILVDAGLSGIEIQRRLETKDFVLKTWMPLLYPTSIQIIFKAWGFFPVGLICRFTSVTKQKRPHNELEVFAL